MKMSLAAKTFFSITALAVSLSAASQSILPPPAATMSELANTDSFKAYVNAMHGFLVTLPGKTFPANAFKSVALSESASAGSSIINGVRSWEGMRPLAIVKSNSSAGKALVMDQLNLTRAAAAKNETVSFKPTYTLYGPEDKCIVADGYANCQAK